MKENCNDSSFEVIHPTRVIPMLAVWMAFWLAFALGGSKIDVGSPLVRGEKIQPFTATWSQKVRRSPDADWQDAGTITETITRSRDDGREVLIREQTTHNPQRGIKTVDTVVADAKTLRPLSWSFKRTGDLPENAPRSGGVEYQGLQVKGKITLSSGRSGPIEVKSPVAVFDAGILGLIIATLPLKDGYEAEIPANFQGRTMYMIRARVVGRHAFQSAKGESVDSWAVKTDWKTLGSDDPYPDDDSGGTFYVVPQPPGGFPMVPRYVNPNFDAQVIPGP